MMRPIALLLICAFAFANSALLGAKECTYGPSYWCASLRNAKTCGAVKHCISTVWEKQTLPKDNGDICELCEDMVNQARAQMESQENQELLKQVFEGSCHLLPIKELEKECVAYVDEFIPELIETLASQMNPQVVCATVGLCNSARVNKLMSKYKGQMKKMKAKAPQSDCKDCEVFVADIKKTALSYSRQELLHRMMMVCGRLDTLSDGCKAIVEMNFPIIYNYLESKLIPKEACEMFGFCDRIYGGKVAKISHRTGDEICDFCESIVQQYKDSLASNTSKAEFKQILDGVCRSTGSFRQECLSLVDQYYELIYDLLVSEVDAQKICEAVGLCGASSVFKNEYSTWTLFNIKPSDHLAIAPQEDNAIHGSQFDIVNPATSRKNIQIVPLADTGRQLPAVEQKQDNACMMCEFVLHFLQDYLQQKPSREQMKAAMDDVCKLMPHSLSEQCQDYVDAYGDQLIEFLIYESDPSTVCPMLHLCPSERSTQLAMSNPDLCLTCEFVVNIVDETLNNNVMDIERTMKVVCGLFPSSVRPQCKSFVDEYGQAIINYLEMEASPKEICTLLKLCKPAETYMGTNYASRLLKEIEQPTVLKKTELKLKQSTECVLCEFIMHELDHFLLFPATKVKIESAVERVCFVLPSGLQADCLSFLEKYTFDMVNLLVDKMEPDVVCKRMSICDQTITTELPVAKVSFKNSKRELLGTDKCTWGPAYWCISEWHASSCKATQHCVENVWRNGIP